MCFATAISLNLSSCRCEAKKARLASRFLPPSTRRAFERRITPCSKNLAGAPQRCELRSLRQAELILLDTYVGDAAAERVLAGRTPRGQIESLEAALLLCDLRDFTGLSNRLPGGRVLELLNEYFDRVIPSIVDAGGEVLKFMGDHESPLSPRCRRLAACWGNLRVGPQPRPNSMPASHSITAISATAISALALASISP